MGGGGCAESRSRKLKSTEVIIGIDQVRLRMDNLGNRSFVFIQCGVELERVSYITNPEDR